MIETRVLALIAAVILLYTVRSFTSKLFADIYPGDADGSTLVFSIITGVLGLALHIATSGGVHWAPSRVTLLCGIGAGVILLLYNVGCIRASQTGPYAILSIIGMFGSVLLPLTFETVFLKVKLTSLETLGIVCVLVSFVLLNLKGLNLGGVKKGYIAWVALVFFANGTYSILMASQQRFTGNAQRTEMVALIFIASTAAALIKLVAGRRSQTFAAFKMPPKGWLYALLSGAALMVAMNLMVYLLGCVSASVLYPIVNSGVLMLLVLLSAIVLHEKIYFTTWMGVALAIAGIAALSL